SRRDSSSDDAVVTVSLPYGTGFITGGGYLVAQASAGQYAASAGTKENFGFNVKFNKSGTNLQGNFNALVRKDGHVYQIKSNSMNSLLVDSSVTLTHPNPTAVFQAKANLQDITNPLQPISLGGNLSLQRQMTDA